MNKILQGDCLIKLKELEDNSVDSIVTDPPYELGFMGKSWDNTGIANNKDMWAECLRVLKPGGYLLSFGGTITYHRMASAIEDAGFEVRDMIEWVYGSGFPKSLNIGKAVDKLQGNEREDLGVRTDIHSHGNNCRTTEVNYPTKEPRLTKGTSEWEGWGTALKPSHEPICMARKPLAEKTVAENVLKYGTGGINIDESRVATDDKMSYSSSERQGVTQFGTGTTEQSPLGRFPANLIHDNSEEVRECFPDSKSQGHWSKTKTTGFGEFGNGSSEYLGVGEKDKEGGNASRFFKSIKTGVGEIEDTVVGEDYHALIDAETPQRIRATEGASPSLPTKSIIYQAKASKSERNKGCEGLEDKDGGCLDGNNDMNNNRKIGANPSQKVEPTKNNHPTVKPIALMEYLIKMVTPKGGIVLDPFAGSGSTLVAAKQNGYQYIGIEMTEEYIPIIEARLKGIKKDNTLF